MSTDTNPTVDIIIAAKNERRSIVKCLTALAAQDYPQSLIHIYVIDGGSTDGTRYLTRKHNATLLTLRTGTIAAARNMGIRSGDSTIVAFLDAHSIPEPDWLRQMVSCLIENKSDACQGIINHEFGNLQLKNLIEAYGMTAASQKERWFSGHWTTYPFIGTGNAVCTRIALEDIGLFDEQLDRTEDLDLSWRLILAGYSLSYCPQGVVFHLDNDDLKSHLAKHFRTGKTLALIAKKYGLFGKDGPALAVPRKEKTVQQQLVSLAARSGYGFGLLTQWLGLAIIPAPTQITVRAKFRPKIPWTQEMLFALSREIVFWRSSDCEFILVAVKTRSRFIFSDSAAVIFDQIIQGASRKTTINELAAFYAIDTATAESDVDGFITELIQQDILIREEAI